MELKRRPDMAMSGPLETIRAAKLNGPELNPPNAKHKPCDQACKHCGEALGARNVGRRKRYCSNACRQAAFRNETTGKSPPMGCDTGDGIDAPAPVENKEKNPLRNEESAFASKQFRFEEYPPRKHKKDPCIAFKLTDGKQVNTGSGRASRPLGFLMEVMPGKWVARVDDRRSEMLPFGAAKKAALSLYHSKGKGTPRNGVADLNRAIVAEIDREDPPSFKRRLRGWVTAPADGSYWVRVVPQNETQQLFAIESTADPECDTAKALLDGGISSNCILLDSNTGRPITHFDIEDRARLASRSATPPPPSEPEHRGATPGALQGDAYQLEYYEDGHPKLPVCLDRRTPNSLLEQPKQVDVLDQIVAKARYYAEDAEAAS